MADKDYKQLEVLGKGSFGSAYLVEHVLTGKKYCMKRIEIRNSKDVDKILSEVKILQSLTHPYIVRYERSFTVSGQLYIVMDYASGGDLHKVVRAQKASKQPFNPEQIIKWFTQLCIALKYVHDSDVIHRDIKLKNILLDENGNIQLADFGVSKVLPQDQQTSTMTGTPHYISPEICRRENYDYKTDIWSLGVVLYELIALTHPFDGSNQEEIMRQIQTGRYKPTSLNGKYSEDINEILGSLLKLYPKYRPSTSEVLNKPIIYQYILNNAPILKVVVDTLAFKKQEKLFFDYLSKSTTPNFHKLNYKDENEVVESPKVDDSATVDTEFVQAQLKKADQLLAILKRPPTPTNDQKSPTSSPQSKHNNNNNNVNHQSSPPLVLSSSSSPQLQPLNNNGSPKLVMSKKISELLELDPNLTFTSQAMLIEFLRSKLEKLDTATQQQVEYSPCFNYLEAKLVDFLSHNTHN